MTNRSFTLYVGVTDNMIRRVWEHKNKVVEGFTKRYKIDKLVYFEGYNNIEDAIRREKQLKGWKRKKKMILIKSKNPMFEDLSEKWR